MKNTLSLIASCVFVVSAGTLLSQAGLQSANPQYCGTEAPSQQWEAVFQQLITERRNVAPGAKPQPVAYTIPVIVHVIHGGQAVGTYPNLAQAQIVSQIQALNHDFGGIGYNSGNYPPSAFASFASTFGLPAANLDGLNRVAIADCGVQFCLATHDTLGNLLPEPGINRVNYITNGWGNPGTINNYNTFKSTIDNVIKPNTIWNPTKYFNIWVTDVNLSAVNLLGFATFPALSGNSGIPGSTGTGTTDGVWCYSKAFGSVDGYPGFGYNSGNDRGRTCTHEVGHWLGLRHIWGDSNCGTDYCNDTPQAAASNFGNPSYPHNTTACANNIPNGEMFMNFMDYVDDRSKYMFTPDQAERIQTTMQNAPYRKFLGTHNLCSVETVQAESQFGIPVQICGTYTPVPLFNQAKGIPVPSFTWTSTGNATFTPGPNAHGVTVTFPSAGIYTVTLTSDNGTTSAISKTIAVHDYPNLTFSASATTACMNDAVTITASGGNTYAWSPGSITGSVVSYVATSDKTYTCVTFGAGNCKSTAAITVYVADCTGINEQGAVSNVLNVFPNPATSTLHFETVNSNVSIQIFDATGKVVMKETVTGKQSVNIASLPNGMYILKATSTNGTQQAIKLIKE